MSSASPGATPGVRTALDPPTVRQAFEDHLRYTVGRLPELATAHDHYLAAAYTIRDRLIHRWLATLQRHVIECRSRMVVYLSAEFLLGPHLGNNLVNLGIYDQVAEALEAQGHSLDALLDQEEEPGLGNGGLGRLAACYLDALATLQIPALGYGIRYEFGIFDQCLRDGWQVELADEWLRYGNPWELARPEMAVTIGFGGHTEHALDENGRLRVRWIPARHVQGIPYDTPILGYRVPTCNTLRLWKAEAHEAFDLQAFNVGDYAGAVEEKVASETLTKVLYPNDEPLQGKRLRLEQQYFFVSCALQDLIRIHTRLGRPLTTFHEHFAIQLNDTHPSLAIPELMRLLVDEHGFAWETAWAIAQRTFAYTNHTLLPEALETWPVALFEEILPRHLEIVYEINRRFLDEVRARYPGDPARVASVSLIDEEGGRRVRMAHLAAVACHSVNGVAALHSELLKRSVMRDFAELMPEKFRNITNGVTLRRFVALANRPLARLITDHIGERWLTHAEELRRLEPLADDPAFRTAWREVKRANKRRLAEHIHARTGVTVDPESLFDVQVKRIHEYKRQHLNALHLVTLYHRLQDDPGLPVAPRTAIFAGKAAPGYLMAKRMIKLLTAIAEVVNADPVTAPRLRVVFLPDYNVKNAQRIYPAADLSEQISTAGMEASGTGNMKLTLNGALTIGTLDGANVEIREAVGAEHFFLFGHSVDEVAALRAAGYRPREYYAADAELQRAIDAIAAGAFSGGDRELFRPLVEHLLGQDTYLLLADYRRYVDCQTAVDRVFRDPDQWTRLSILNVARAGMFSADRAIREYAENIWHVQPVPVQGVHG